MTPDIFISQAVNCPLIWLCIKVGQGQGDRDIGMRAWGLGDVRQGTGGHQVWDAGT